MKKRGLSKAALEEMQKTATRSHGFAPGRCAKEGTLTDLMCRVVRSHRRWRSSQQLSVVVAPSEAAFGIGSTAALPPRRMSSKTGFKQTGSGAEGTMIASGPPRIGRHSQGLGSHASHLFVREFVVWRKPRTGTSASLAPSVCIDAEISHCTQR